MGNPKGSNTTTTQTSPNPAAMAQYQQLLYGANLTAQQNPWENYSGQFVAPINQQQTTGIGNINQFAQEAQPYIQTAGGLALSGATPISAGDIQNYYNPWQQNVIGATQAQFNEMNARQQQQVLGNAAAQGALGGDRTGVTQATLAGQQQLSQAPVIAGLESQGFNQAAQLALAAKQQQAQGAYSLGNLGVAGQQAGLSGAGAQIQAGTLQQQNQQALDAALYNQFLMSRAFPYQQQQWLAGIGTGVGSQMGGTSSTTGPSPSLLAQILGLGTAGVGAAGQAGAFKPSGAAQGGRIAGFADGGAPSFTPQELNLYHHHVANAGGSGKVANPDGSTSTVYQAVVNGPGGKYYSVPTIWGGKVLSPDAAAQQAERTGWDKWPSYDSPEAADAHYDKLHDYMVLAPYLDRWGGGRIPGFAAGGSPGIGSPLFGGVGYIPSVTITKGLGAPKPPEAYKPPTTTGSNQSPFQKWMFEGFKSGSTSGDGSSGDSFGDDAARGGAIGYDNGGPVTSAGFGLGSRMLRGYEDGGEVRIFADPAAQHDYMPNLALTGGPGPPQPPKVQSQSGGGGGSPSIPWGEIAGGVGSALAGLGSAAGAALGGGEAGATAGAMLALARKGGRIRGYDEGGEVIELPPDAVPQEVPVEAMAAWREGVDRDVSRGASPQLVGGFGPPPELPPEIIAGTSRRGVEEPATALAYDQPARTAGVGTSPSVADEIISRYRQGLPAGTVAKGRGESVPWSSPENNLWPSLMAAGLGIMSSKSPFPGVAIGEGGMQGLHTYQGLGQQQRAEQMSQQKVQMAADNLMLRTDQEQKKMADEAKKLQYMGWTIKPDGSMTPTPGGPHDPETIKAAAIAKGENIVPWTDPNTGNTYFFDKGTRQWMTPPGVNAPGGGAPAVPGAPTAAPTSPDVSVPGGPKSPNLPSSPLNASAAGPEVKVASADGFVPRNSALVESNQAVNYSRDAPYVEKGSAVPAPAPIGGKSTSALQSAAEFYLSTGKLPSGFPIPRGNSPAAIQQKLAMDSVINYAGALAASRGMTPEETAQAWRSAPGMLRFILGADGRSTVALGTAMRHLDTIKELASEWDKATISGNWQTVRAIQARVMREFGQEAGTNLQAAARIMGPEIIKAIGIAGGGTAEDRHDAASAFTTAASLPQVLGAVNVTQRLMLGQLQGKENQALSAGLTPDRFKTLIGPREYERLKQIEGGGGGAAAAPARSPSDQQALDWAGAHPNDPRAAEIKKRLGVP